jgi:hypothetical protein
MWASLGRPQEFIFFYERLEYGRVWSLCTYLILSRFLVRLNCICYIGCITYLRDIQDYDSKRLHVDNQSTLH